MNKFKDIKDLLKFLESKRVFNFDPDYDGGCPCALGAFKVANISYYFHTHCWRKGLDNGKQEMEWFQTAKDDLGIRKLVLAELNNYKWYNSYKVTIDKNLPQEYEHYLEELKSN